jgi:hypothetical protein
MRYRLRSLLILTALLGVVFARLAHVQHKMAFHRRESAKAAQRVAKMVGDASENVMSYVPIFAKYDSEFKVNPWGNPWDLESEELAVDWKQAVYHEATAVACSRAWLLPARTITIESASSRAANAARLQTGGYCRLCASKEIPR